MIGIIGAMAAEVELLTSAVTNPKTKTVSGIEFVSGKLQGKDVVIARCGIGKVFAAICAQTMILEYKPDVIINTGVAGALSASLTVGDIVISSDAVQYDMDTSALGDPKGLISGINVIHFLADKKAVSVMQSSTDCKTFVGTVASGDKFVSDMDEKRKIADEFGATVCEMEGGAIAQVCYVNKTPFVIVRAVSDSLSGGVADYGEFVKTAAKNSADAVKKAVLGF